VSGSDRRLLEAAGRFDRALRFAIRARPNILAFAESTGLNELGLEPGDVDTLDQVAATGESTMSAIAAGLRVERSSATRAVSRLVDKGLVVKRRDPNDARVTLVSFTAPGVAVQAEARARRTAMAARLLARFDEADQATIGRLLPELADAIIDELGATNSGRGGREGRSGRLPER